MTKMKDSGIEWIGEIPENWEVVRFKNISKFSSSGIDKKIKKNEYEVKIVNYVDVYNNRNKELENSNYMKVTASLEKTKEHNLLKGDMLFTPSSETSDEIGYSAVVMENLENTSYSYHLIRARFYKNLNDIFKKYIFNNYYVLNQFSMRSRGTTRKTLNRIDFKDINLIIPPKDQQEKIANFLDQKVGEIDRLIEKTKEVIGDYKSYKQALITETVTKGLRKDVPLKYSGIEWIGDIPEHWEVVKLKYLVERPLEYGANSSGCKYDDKLPRYIRITDIDKNNQLKNVGRLSINLTESKKFILANGDILFARSGGTVGKTYIHDDSMGKAAFAGYLIRAKINRYNNSKFIFYITLSSYYHQWKEYILIQATIENIGAEKYKNFHLPIPPLDEQKEIADYLDEKCGHIDRIIETKEGLIKELEAYKKSLIYETVTGKREVD